MHGLINRAIQDFVRDSFGDATWAKVARQAGLEPPSFEPMLSYDDQITEQVIAASSGILSRRPSDVLEDIGHYLVTHERLAPLRRLLRFGGVDFVDFLHTLDDLPDWARLAVDDLILPPITLIEESPGAWRLELRGAPRGAGQTGWPPPTPETPVPGLGWRSKPARSFPDLVPPLQLAAFWIL